MAGESCGAQRLLWILRTGAPWADLPDRYPSYQTCHRRFQQWVRAGVLRGVLEVLAQALHDEGYLDLQETFIDGSFAPAKQGGAGVGKTKRGKGSKIMAIADRGGLPVAVHIESATPHEVTLVHATLAQRFVKPFPVRLIGDNVYESDRLDADLARRGVELIAPHRKTRTSRTQDARLLRHSLARFMRWLLVHSQGDCRLDAECPPRRHDAREQAHAKHHEAVGGQHRQLPSCEPSG
jgi:Putative transposase of IS4/5 family (DUF4096)/Transposase DDE domain